MAHPGFITALMLLASAGAFAQSQNLTMQIGGVARKYILYAPTGLPANPPLVYVIHGFNMTGQQEVGLTKMNAVADKGKFLVVYPDALLDASNQPSWDMSGQNDYKFLLAIIDSADAKYHIDRNKVYASGFSQGGFMSFQLGCRYADKFAAIAPVSGLLNGTCKPSRAVPMFLTFGTADVATPASFMQSVDAWVKLAECPATPKVTRPYPATNPNSVVTRIEYGPCKDGTAVMADSVKGGPHEWPMNTQTKVNNSEEVWAFFQKYSLPTAMGIGGNGPGARAGRLSASFAHGKIRLHGARDGITVRILDTRGRVVAAAPAGPADLEFEGIPGGVYQVLASGNGESDAFTISVP
jgi:poly(hydroxyalkanoate) depolymerase family esterase